jgi:hypothetical protein
VKELLRDMRVALAEGRPGRREFIAVAILATVIGVAYLGVTRAATYMAAKIEYDIAHSPQELAMGGSLHHGRHHKAQIAHSRQETSLPSHR